MRSGIRLFLFLYLWALPAFCWPPTWGIEPTFSRKDLKTADHLHVDRDTGEEYNSPWAEENQAALEEYYEAAKKKLKGRADIKSVKFEEEADKWLNDNARVTYRDGFHIFAGLDPYVLEAGVTPFLLTDFIERYQDRVQTDLFDLMASRGLKPFRNGLGAGGGHLHMGAESTFGDDVQLLRNFIVDICNHPELAYGALEMDLEDAIPLLKLKKSQKLELARVIADVDSGKIKTPRKLATAFYARVIFEGEPHTGKRIEAAKHLQINLLRMANLDTWDTLEPNESWTDYEAWIQFDEDHVPKKARTLEVRHLRAQMNVQELIDDIRLHEGRLTYLKNLTEPLELSPEFLVGQVPTPVRGARDFYRYLTQAGMDPVRYLKRLPKPGDAYVKKPKEWRKTFEKLLLAHPCAKNLGVL